MIHFTLDTSEQDKLSSDLEKVRKRGLGAIPAGRKALQKRNVKQVAPNEYTFANHNSNKDLTAQQERDLQRRVLAAHKEVFGG